MAESKFPIDWNRALDVLLTVVSLVREIIETLKLCLGA